MAGTLRTQVQLGDSTTETQNFTLTSAAADGTMKLARGNAGATTQDILTVDAAGKVSAPQGLLPTNGSGVIIRTALSAAYTAASGEFLSASHGLSFTPSSCKLIFECISADAGYSVGDRVHVPNMWNGATTVANSPYVDSTVAGWRAYTGYNAQIPNKTTSAGSTPTATKWKYYFEVTA